MQCNLCHTEKPIEDMIPNRNKCRKCHNAKCAQYRETNREKHRHATRTWIAKNKDEILARRRSKYPEKKKQRDTIKQTLVDLRGGRCISCGYNKCLAALDFHHLDPTQKEFRIGAKTSMLNDEIIAEVNKCVILCANCHREYHAGLLII